MDNGKEPTTTTADATAAGAAPLHPRATASSTASPNADVANDAAVATSKQIEPGTKFYGVQFRVHVSMRYHQARRSWWTNLNRLSSAAGALAGSAALVAVFAKAHAEVWAYVSAGSGAIAALNAALGFSERAREHADLYRGFSAIAARMASAPAADDAAARTFESEVLQLEAMEGPTINTLNVICHNQECEARGLTQEHRCKVYLINRVFKSIGTVWDSFPPLPPKES